jgi:hypothetical protein
MCDLINKIAPQLNSLQGTILKNGGPDETYLELLGHL